MIWLKKVLILWLISYFSIKNLGKLFNLLTPPTLEKALALSGLLYKN